MGIGIDIGVGIGISMEFAVNLMEKCRKEVLRLAGGRGVADGCW